MEEIMIRLFLLTGLLSVTFLACNCSKSNDNAKELQRLQEAPKTAAIAGEELTLATFIWRNFMPAADPKAVRPILATLTLQTTDQKPLPAGITVEQVWLINDDQLWTTTEMELFPLVADSPHQTVKLRNGPEWETGIMVDVVLQLRDSQQEICLIKASAQEVERVE
jgi:hypothetical protein